MCKPQKDNRVGNSAKKFGKDREQRKMPLVLDYDETSIELLHDVREHLSRFESLDMPALKEHLADAWAPEEVLRGVMTLCETGEITLLPKWQIALTDAGVEALR